VCRKHDQERIEEGFVIWCVLNLTCYVLGILLSPYSICNHP